MDTENFKEGIIAGIVFGGILSLVIFTIGSWIFYYLDPRVLAYSQYTLPLGNSIAAGIDACAKMVWVWYSIFPLIIIINGVREGIKGDT